MRRDDRDGSGRNRVATEHSRPRHTLRSFPQVVRHRQQGPTTPVHRFREAQSGHSETSAHGQLYFGPLRQVRLRILI